MIHNGEVRRGRLQLGQTGNATRRLLGNSPLIRVHQFFPQSFASEVQTFLSLDPINDYY